MEKRFLLVARYRPRNSDPFVEFSEVVESREDAALRIRRRIESGKMKNIGDNAGYMFFLVEDFLEKGGRFYILPEALDDWDALGGGVFDELTGW